MVLTKTMFLLLLQHWVFMATHAVLQSHHQPPRHTLLTDQAALLEFKKAIKSDPKSILSSWNETVFVCNFTWVVCDKNQHRVTNLTLVDAGLVGPISPFISNLTGLRSLHLANNNFYGTIPQELSSLRFLRRLRLEGNNLVGPIPDSFGLLARKRLINLSYNLLIGAIPLPFFSNCTSLHRLDLSNNRFRGEVPEEIGNCQNLEMLNLYGNQFLGRLPSSFMNLTFLAILDIEFNHFSGELPSEIVGKLPYIEILHLSNNEMVSHNLDIFFMSLSNCTYLRDLELAEMGLEGSLTVAFDKLSTGMTSLLLQENKLFGSIPPSLGRFSNLLVLNLSGNLLNGSISEEIGSLPNLQGLLLSNNSFTGAIPAALGQLPSLVELDLSYNMFSGEIPAELGNLVQLNSLYLSNNLLSGTIPPTLGNLMQVYRLDLSYNQLTGRIPPKIIGINEIRIFLNLSHNALEGPIPIELSKLEKVQEIDLSSNKLSGSIFSQISSCIELRVINFSHNSLEGHLPDSLGNLKNLESLDVSGNHLTGPIPASLNKVQSLTFLNLSSNNFEGLIPQGGIFNTVTPDSFWGNKHLCGAVLRKSCSQKKYWFRSHIFLIISVSVVSISACITIICCVIGFRRIQVVLSSQKTEAADAPAPKSLEVAHNFPRITYRELSEATQGFDQQSLIGSGSYGRVFKGVLPDGTAVAVKVLMVQSGNSTKSFNRECQVLKRIRHRNLIRIITACSLPDFKALVLPYMANGSLDGRLYPHSGTGLGSGSSDLNLIQRVNICSDVAEGMAYLHHHSPVRVIHCDLKPSNVLLNDEMTALVSDFGIARLVTAAGGNAAPVENMGNSTANMLTGSIGYIAPEYAFGSNTSTKGDIYSFGVLVLEMVTRKRPTDDMFAGGLNLHRWVKSHYHGRMERIIDSSLLRASRDQSPEIKRMWEVAIWELVELGILCTQDSPSMRPTMLDVADDLDRLKRYLSGDTTATFASSLGISSSTLGDD